jgi:methionyl-tRNA formyltransferase
VGDVTTERSFKISYAPSGVTNVLYADFESFAALHECPVLRMKDSLPDPALFAAVEALTPDAFVVVSWYHMIPRRWRELAPAFGLYAPRTPDFSGGAPLFWVMINGESKTRITLFQIDDGVDSGPVAAQPEDPIRSDDTIATLYARIEERGLDLLDRTLPRLASRDLYLHPQPKSVRRVMPQRSPEEGRIDWCCDAAFIDRWIRAQTRPYPGAFTDSAFGRLTIWASRTLAERPSNALPGLVFRITCGDIGIACGAGALQVTDASLRMMTHYADAMYEVKHLVGTVLGKR